MGSAGPREGAVRYILRNHHSATHDHVFVVTPALRGAPIRHAYNVFIPFFASPRVSVCIAWHCNDWSCCVLLCHTLCMMSTRRVLENKPVCAQMWRSRPRTRRKRQTFSHAARTHARTRVTRTTQIAKAGDTDMLCSTAQ
jgi:hypothetical protein